MARLHSLDKTERTVMAGLWERAVASALMLFGVVTIYAASSYQIGSFSDMGPGYFPTLIGALLVIIGLANLAAVWNSSVEVSGLPWRSFLLVFGGILAWALLVERAGLVPASCALIALATFARPPVNLIQLVSTAIISSLLSALIFIGGFGLPLKMFVW
jgi:hypothetical protein